MVVAMKLARQLYKSGKLLAFFSLCAAIYLRGVRGNAKYFRHLLVVQPSCE
jgi:hypothetical protein